ncbi:uncharacterized protein J8A68_004715 [[Candida] subhashii]|uniref:Uncharacterized protein n=1 Tax=[Candida] subhashii TaxID=561895 RepID=A0A8J5QF28_9ASCO|nr:uncharacterized protein J8A68_004715 [[Candida] subhashii]KAG7661767.1 hypothetical protein J8A68_004715 [[Candida] subhashii]
MAIFRSKTNKKSPSKAGHIDVKISPKDQQQYKMHTANVHDPILTAVNEDQPFEQAARHENRRPSYLSNDSADLKDIFGRPIRQGDMSNPTRERNERPLDTIRGFEYAITGDVSYRDQLESHRLGWGFHEDFPYYNLSGQTHNQEGNSRPVINFDQHPIYEEQGYVKPSGQKTKKKKKGFFRRN